jgi:hypothetical protein
MGLLRRKGALNQMIPLNSALRNSILYVAWLSVVNPVSMVPLADHTMETFTEVVV